MRVLRGLVVTSVLALAAIAQERPTDAVRRLLDAHGCQTTLPGNGDGAGTGTGPGARGGGGRRARNSLTMAAGAGSATLAQVLLWGVVAAAIVVLVAAAVRGSSSAAVASGSGAGPRTVSPTPDAPDGPLPDPARLAAAGDFAAALRALLLRAFHVVHGVANVPHHATARELLRRVRADRSAAEFFTGLVDTVERVHFGGRPADRELYEASHARFAAWEQGRRAGAPAVGVS